MPQNCPGNSECLCFSYKGLVAEALRQLVGEHGYKQDEVLAPGYYTGDLSFYLAFDKLLLFLFCPFG